MKTLLKSALVLLAGLTPLLADPGVTYDSRPNAGFYVSVLHGGLSDSFLTLKIKDPSKPGQPKKYSGKLMVDGNVLSVSGKFVDTTTVFPDKAVFIDTLGSNVISRAKFGKNPLTITIAGGASDMIQVQIYEPFVFDQEAEIYQTLPNVLFAETPQQYSVLLDRPDALFGRNTPIPTGPKPSGYGAAVLKVSTNGVAKVAGFLADGTKIAQSVLVNPNQPWPLYVPIYPVKQTITNLDNPLLVKDLKVTQGIFSGDNIGLPAPIPYPEFNQISQNYSWYKKADSTGLYPDGFIIYSLLEGLPYVQPELGQRVVEMENGFGRIYLEGSDLDFGSINDSFLLTEANKFSVGSATYKLRLGVTLKTGLFRGSFAPVSPLQPVKFTGILMQDYSILREGTTLLGGGFFLGNTEAGRVVLFEGSGDK